MALEIERKFLLRGDGWRAGVSASSEMRQGYLNQEARASVRVRREVSESGEVLAFLNIKSATVGAVRHEYEYAIPESDAVHLLESLCAGPLVEKRRYQVPFGQHVWEIDEFFGDNAGLMVAEVELGAEDEAFLRPDWLGQEVTGDVRFYNTCLSRHPFSAWREDERQAVLAAAAASQ
ncbi:MAG: hypothetical protein RIQ52_1644 [Pseudomonadota bacterium]|jgi:adenylate cyclase